MYFFHIASLRACKADWSTGCCVFLSSMLCVCGMQAISSAGEFVSIIKASYNCSLTTLRPSPQSKNSVRRKPWCVSTCMNAPTASWLPHLPGLLTGMGSWTGTKPAFPQPENLHLAGNYRFKQRLQKGVHQPLVFCTCTQQVLLSNQKT